MKHILTLVFLFQAGILASQPQNDIATSLTFRSIGPAFMTGRIADIVKEPGNSSTWYVAVASGGVWKTLNNGTTWEPIFDDYPVYSTGALAIDPLNPATVWLGTGENQSQRSVGWGDGVYRSDDRGKSWTNLGLRNSEHIGKIIIDPRNSDVIYVAAQGPLWKSGGDRGVYKTTNGGRSWTNVLSISENTGVADLSFEPGNPDVIYAASYQRRRHVGILVAGGPESRIYKSSDQGENWKMLSKGLPDGDVGRIAIAVSPIQPEVVYASISADPSSGGFFKSTDRGESWTKQSDYMVIDPQYYGEIYCHPTRFDHVYSVDMMAHYTTNGGKSFERINSNSKHVDNHSIVFDQGDPDYIMIGTDGGIYESWDNTESWKYIDNLPIVQFYRVGIDNSEPFYNVYGGTQDNSTLGGPSQTFSRHGITNQDWTLVLGGDGFQARVDPEDPNTVYAQSQYAGIVRYDRSTGSRIDLQPQPELTDDPLRWHWDSPLIISPHNPKRLYFAAQKLFRSDDRGDSWQAISGDLSRGENRNQRAVMGKLWPPEAVWKNVFTSPYGTIVALSESTVDEGLLVVGTDDGLIQISEDGGSNWRKTEKFPEVPPKAYVADVVTSQHDRNTIYAVFNNHKEGDFKPYVIKSTNLGKTWLPIVTGIGQTDASWSLVEDHLKNDLLFLGTEFGLWCSLNGGQNWFQMKNGLPTIAVRDLEIQKRENDLVLATFGRGFYILDDYSILRSGSSVTSNSLFEIPDAWIFIEKGNLGYGRKGVFGTGFYTADNPPYGARIQVYLTDVPSSVKQNRDKSNYPGYDQLKAEDLEIAPKMAVQIRDESGSVVDLVRLTNKKGYQEVNWDLQSWVADDDGNRRRVTTGVGPGSYSAQLVRITDERILEIDQKRSFQVTYWQGSEENPSSDYYAFGKEVAQAMLEVDALREKLKVRMKSTEDKLNNETNPDVYKQLVTLRKSYKEIEYQLEDDPTLSERSEYRLPGIARRISNIYWSGGESFQVTETQRTQLKLATKELANFKLLIDQMDD